MRSLSSDPVTRTRSVDSTPDPSTERTHRNDGQLVAYVPTHSRSELGALSRRDQRSARDDNSAFSMLCRARSMPGPERLFVDSHESALRMLSGLTRYCQTGSLGFAAPEFLNRALKSYGKDCKAIFRAHKSMRKSSLARGVKAPLTRTCVDGGFEGWMGAMKDLAIFRKALRPERLRQLMPYVEARSGKPNMHHNFTKVRMGGLDNVLIHNTKASNGEGATRVMSLVAPTGPGTFGIIRPDSEALGCIFAREGARDELAALQRELDGVNNTIRSLRNTIGDLQDKMKGLPEERQAGLKKGVSKCQEKLAAPLKAQAKLLKAEALLKAKARQPAPRMLDLSYDDIHIGLQQLQRANGWSDSKMAGALLDLLVGGGSRETVRALAKPLCIKGIKVKDVLNPRDDPKTGDVEMSGFDLCQTLLSIMFLTEPKHALPMAVANHDALKAVVAGSVPLSALFAPVEIRQENGQLSFGLGGDSDNLGALLASANNLRTVLDPSDPTTRAYKEQAMPLCETSSLDVSPDSLGAILQGHTLPQDEAQQAAVLFPVLKSILMRALVEKRRDH